MKKKLAKKKRHEYQSSYLHVIYGHHFRKLVNDAAKMLRKIRKTCPFDAIAFTGSSGAGFGYPLSYVLNIPVIYIRKRNNNSHSTLVVEGCIDAKRYLIVDDCISSGTTIKTIIKEIKTELEGKSKPAGIFLYASYRLAKFQRLPVYCL